MKAPMARTHEMEQNDDDDVDDVDNPRLRIRDPLYGTAPPEWTDEFRRIQCR